MVTAQDFVHRRKSQNNILNKWHNMKVLLKRFHLNGNTITDSKVRNTLQDFILYSGSETGKRHYSRGQLNYKFIFMSTAQPTFNRTLNLFPSLSVVVVFFRTVTLTSRNRIISPVGDEIPSLEVLAGLPRDQRQIPAQRSSSLNRAVLK